MRSISKICVALAVITTIGCEKTVDVKIPAGVYNTTTIFASDESAQAGMRGIYQSMTTGGFAGKTNPFIGVLASRGGLAADELVRTSYGADDQRFLDNNLIPEVSITAGIWASFYNYIYQCNMMYESAERSTGLSTGVRDELMGEARFVRGLSLFYLTNLYGNVPMTLTSDYETNAQLPPSSQADIYAQVIADLLEAKDKLGDQHLQAGNRYRANQWAATALLARVYLYQQDWAKAEAAATEVIGQEAYQLETLDGVFQEASTEAIWQLANPGANLYTSEASLLSGGSSTTNRAYHLSPYLLSKFETGDQRMTVWARSGTGTGVGTFAPVKFKTYSNSQEGAVKEASTPLRLAEVYLIRSEARAMQDNLSGAIADLDEIRQRAGAVDDSSQAFQTIESSNPNISQPDLLALIYEERLRELFAENGHRWLDAKRAEGTLAAFFGDRKPEISETDAYFPIPANDVEFNNNLEQNDGY